MESIAITSGRIASACAHTSGSDVSHTTSRSGASVPSRSARRRTCAADSSAHTSRQRAPAAAIAPSACSTSVLLPMPGSPPTSVTEPATRPPPSTRSSSGTFGGAPRARPSGSTSASGTGCEPASARAGVAGAGAPTLERAPLAALGAPARATWATRDRTPGTGTEQVFVSCGTVAACDKLATQPVTRLGAPDGALVVGFDLDMTLVDSAAGHPRQHETRWPRETGVPIDVDVVIGRLGPKLEWELAQWFPADQVDARCASATAGSTGTTASATARVLLPAHACGVDAVRARGGRRRRRDREVGAARATAASSRSGSRPTRSSGTCTATRSATRSSSTAPGSTWATPSPTCASAIDASAIAVGVTTGPDDARKLLAAGADLVLDSLDEFPPWLATDRANAARGPEPIGPMEESWQPRQRDGGARTFFRRGEFVDDFDAEFDTCGAAPTAWPTSCSATGASPRTSPRRRWRARSVRWKKVSAYAEPWVVRVAGNLAIDRVRRRQRTRGLPAADLPGVDAQRVDLQRALLALSPKQREVVVLRYLVDLPEAEVARDARLLGRHGQDARVARARRAAEVAGGRAVSGFDFDALRDPDAPLPGSRERARWSTRGRDSCGLARAVNRLASSVGVDRRRRRDRGSASSRRTRDDRSGHRERSRHGADRPTAAVVVGDRFVPPTTIENGIVTLPGDAARRRDLRRCAYPQEMRIAQLGFAGGIGVNWPVETGDAALLRQRS